MNDRPKKNPRNATDLAALGLIDPERIAEIDKIAARHAIALTFPLIELICQEGHDGPIRRQFIPDQREMTNMADERKDPIGDMAHSPLPGIIHRYPDRVLLIPSMNCPAYCRFCFRRGKEKGFLGRPAIQLALDYISSHPAIWEVILTGGDPLMLSPAKLEWIIKMLGEVDHLKVIRIHSRVPIIAPNRITPALIAAIDTEKAVWMVIHCNHSSELTEKAKEACRKLSMAGIPLLSQTVLLRGINDEPQVMENLLRDLVASRIKPYYLHHLDLAEGTNHFRTKISAGQNIIRQLRGRVSGLCQPTYVLDIPGGAGKSPIGPQFHDGEKIMDWQGKEHVYTAEDSGEDISDGEKIPPTPLLQRGGGEFAATKNPPLLKRGKRICCNKESPPFYKGGQGGFLHPNN